MHRFFLPIMGLGLLLACKPKSDPWFVFQPAPPDSMSVINMTSWLDAPAGKHGFLQAGGDSLLFEDGTPIKFWGVNICSERPYFEADTIDKWIRFLAFHGINGVRFHKFTSHGLTGDVSTIIDSSKYARFDYFQQQLREAGIYYGWSPIYGHKPLPGDSSRMLAYGEIAQADLGNHLSRSTIGLVNFAEDLQQLHIDLIVGMLKHTNPFTGLRYADDPALAFVELHNEDDIFFSTTDQMLERCPSYKKLLTDRFTHWLRVKYANQKGLEKAWGDAAFAWGHEVRNTNWNLDKANITPVANQGIYDYEYRKYATRDSVLPRFLADMAAFLYEQQMTFYKKFEAAIRATGYRGAIVGSCWQAGSGVAHFLNLHTDYEVGIIDRHNYYGGGTGHQLKPGKYNNTSMLQRPGSGLLSTGLQMVSGHPFALSEWLSLMPNDYLAEGPVIVAAYGLGLQGWDASFAFASDFTGYTSAIHTPGVYNINVPNQIGLYPALTSAIYDGDFSEGEVVSVRQINIETLKNGKLGFKDDQTQDWDQKRFGGDVPADILALGKALITYGTRDGLEQRKPASGTIDTLYKTIEASNKQLTWRYGTLPGITINTQGLVGYTGFSDGSPVGIGEFTFAIDNPFAVVLISSLDRGKSLDECTSALVTTMARVRNSGMVFAADSTWLLDAGTSPVMIEGVIASVDFGKRIPKKVEVLDVNGIPAGKLLSIRNGKVNLDGARHKTFYYRCVF